MKKFIVKETGQEIKIGDRCTIAESKTTPYGEGKLITEVEITKETLHNLIKDGVVEVREEKTDAEKAEELKKLVDSMFIAFKKLAKDNDEPFDKVIMRIDDDAVWTSNIFSHIDQHGEYVPIGCVGGYPYCIPYNEETAHLLGTTDEWKGGEG